MLLTIYGLPSNVDNNELKATIKQECNLDNFIMDVLVTDVNHTKKVRVGVADKSEGNRVMQCLNGFRFRGNILRVEPVVKSNRSTQPVFNQQVEGSIPLNPYQAQTNNIFGDHVTGPMNSNTAGPRHAQDAPRGSTWAQNNQWNHNRGPPPQTAQNDCGLQQQQKQINDALRKKQQEIIEEKKKLLAESQKLEMMKKFGAPGASNDFNHAGRPQNQPQRSKKVALPKRVPLFPRGKGGVHVFAMPVRHISKQMRPTVCLVTRGKEIVHLRKKLMIALRFKLRQILTVAVEGKGYLVTSQIIELFRELHPAKDDEIFIRNLFKTIQNGNGGKNKVQPGSSDAGGGGAGDYDCGSDDDDDYGDDDMM